MRTPKNKPLGRMTKEEKKIRDEIEAKAHKFEGRRKGQSKGKGLPEGWYLKAGNAHRFDAYLDSIRSAKTKLRKRDQKDTWRGDYGITY